MAKITKIQIKEYVQRQLRTNPSWALQGLTKIFDFQTEEEKEYESTHVHNGVGFTGADGEILASFAKQFKQRGSLSPKQMDLLYKKMPKYWKQIISISDQEKLLQLVAK